MAQYQYGAPTHCICPQCGEKVMKTRGHPCREQVCLKCGTKMVRFDEVKPPTEASQ